MSNAQGVTRDRKLSSYLLKVHSNRPICDFCSRPQSQVLKHTEGDPQHGNIWIKDMIKMKLHIRYLYNSKFYVYNYPLE